MIHVCVNRTSPAFSRDQRENLPRSLRRTPFSNRWSEERASLAGISRGSHGAPAPPLPRVSRGERSREQAPPPRSRPGPSEGSSVSGPVRPRWVAAAGGEGAQAAGPVRGAIHQQDGYCWEEFLPGGMNLQ